MSTQTPPPEEYEHINSGKPDKSGLYVVCNGAECICDMSNEGTKATLKVLSQNKIYVNDKEGSEKLVANTNDLGIPFEVPVQTFGTCKKQPMGASYKPCIPNIMEWKDPYEAIVLDNQGKALVDDSEGTCAFGGKITFETHGQSQAVSKQDAEAATNDIATVINPALNEEDIHELIAGQFTTNKEDNKGASVKSIETEDNKYGYHFTKPDISFNVKKYSSGTPTEEQKAGINWVVFYKGKKDKNYKEIGKYPDIGENFDFPFQTQGTFVIEAYGGKKGPYFIKKKSLAAYKKITLVSQKLEGISGPFVGTEDRSQYKRVRPDETVTIKADLLFNQKDLKTALSGKKHMQGVVWEAKAYEQQGKTKIDVPVEIIKDKKNPKQVTIAPLGKNAKVTVTATNPDAGTISTMNYTVGSNYVIRIKANKETISVWDGKEQKKERHQVKLEVAKYVIEPARQAEKDAVKWTSFCLGEKPNTDNVIATGHSTVQLLQEEAEMIYEAYGIRPTGGESQSAKKVIGILPKITKAYWADKKGNQIHRSGFEHEVYIHIETEGLTGEKLKLNVWESDKKSADDFVKNAGTDIEITAQNGVIHQSFTLPESHYLEQEYFFTIQELPCIVGGTKQDSDCNNEYVLWSNWTHKKTHYLYVNNDKKITSLRMYENGNKLHTGIVKYGDSVTVKVETRNYVDKTLVFKIYEDFKYFDTEKDETISIPIDSQGKGETQFTVPTAWEPDHKDACIPRYFYLEYDGEEFPRSFYIKSKGKEENEVESKPRVRALMLKVSTTLELDEKLEADNAVILGSELNVSTSASNTCESLIWGEKFTCTEREKVLEVAENLGIGKDKIEGANWLMAVMALETGGTFDPSITNSLGYTGLIQFGKSAAESLGTTRDKLRKMTVVEQLTYVEKYFNKYKSKLKTITDVYLAVLYPVASGHGEEKNYVVFDDSKKAYMANPTFFYEDDEVDKDKNGKITKRHGKIGGKTYIWEVKMAIQTWYSKGNAKKNTCKTDASTCEFGSSAGKFVEGVCPDCEKTHVDLSIDNHWEKQPPGQCYATCIEILKKYGVAPKDRTHQILIANQNRNSITTLNTKEGIDYINSQLEKGNPIIVGVDRSSYKATYNHHKATDHFVLIVGRLCRNGKVQYHFYEVGTKYKDKGISTNNLFILENDFLKGSPVYNSNHKYTVTEVRRNN